MLHRLRTRLSRAYDPVAVALPSDAHADPESVDLSPRRRPGRRALSTALLVPGALLVASTCALLWTGPAPAPRYTILDPYRNHSNVNVYERFEIRSRDGSASVTLIPLGATIVDFWVRDRDGAWRDVVLGYDNMTDYLTDARRPYYGAVVGRVANRIANASYTDPVTHRTVHLAANEVRNDGRTRTTLHGGGPAARGYAQAGWSIIDHGSDRITFGLRDPGASPAGGGGGGGEEDTGEGFPGAVEVRATYALEEGTPSGAGSGSGSVRLTTRLEARVLPSASTAATARADSAVTGPPPSSSANLTSPVTPIMLSSHVYWNLDGFQAPPHEIGRGLGGSARDHRLWVDAQTYLETDGDLIPTGKIAPIEPDSPLDFSSRGRPEIQRDSPGVGERKGMAEGTAPTIGERVDLPQARGLCGSGCKGLDTALLFRDGAARNVSALEPMVVLESHASGIRLSIRTNQPALHIFTTPSPPWGLPHPLGLPRKRSHLPHGKTRPEDCTAEERTYPHGGAVALECEGLVDAVHHVGEEGWEAEDPWYHPGRPYQWWSEYELSTF